MSKKTIIFLLILGVLAAAAVWHLNIFSREILIFEVLGPAEIDAGESFEYVVKYKNNGTVRLEEPRLIFEYPSHSIVEDNILRKEIELEDIYPGEERAYRFQARLLGREGDIKTAKAFLSYRPKNLKARYESATTFTSIIKSVPLTFRFDLPTKIESAKDFTFNLNYFSSIDYPLINLRVKVEYPPDFEFIKSTPQSLEKIEWALSPLNKAEGGRIEIEGRIRGEVGQQKIFKAQFGSWQDGEFILLKEIFKGIEITKPTLYITQQINGNPEYIASPGDLLHYEIFFRNTGEQPLTDLSLLVTLEGRGYDLNTLKAPEGTYNPGDNSIIWDWRRLGKLQFLNVREEGKIEFWVELKDDWEIASSEGKEKIKTRVYLSQVTEYFETKVNSRLELSQKGYFEEEIFGNSGPLPPRVGQITTYTIVWQVKNYFNDLKDVKIKAVLGNGVWPTGNIFPPEETFKFTYDTESKEVIWDIGELKAGQGIFNLPPMIAFQVSFTPSEFLRGKIPEIIKEAEIIAEDTWTRETLRSKASGVNTDLPDDPTVTQEMGIVQ